MTADNGRKADTVYCEINIVVLEHYTYNYKLVWLAVIGEKLHLKKEPTTMHNDFAVAIIKGLSDSGPHSTKLLENKTAPSNYSKYSI